MFSIGNYEVFEQLSEGPHTVVYRALHVPTQNRVILKALKAEYPPKDEIIRLKREYEIAREIGGEGIVRPITLEPYRNGYMLVLEDCGGDSLYHHLSYRPFDLNTFLQVAIRVTEALGRLHQHGIIHKDLKPHNLIANLDTGVVQISDFGIASLLSAERQEIINPDQLEGTLNYMSPEQTGRMNRMIDYRTDMYSLGVTFYELLTGQLPFIANDPLEIVHCHIAKTATVPHEVLPSVPNALSEIVMRCLAKNAEDRYQSAYGLKRDFEECLRQWEETGEIREFPIGRNDRSEIFQIPEKLYGRADAMLTLQTVFNRVTQGTRELLLVTGPSGIGKSFFVHEIHKNVAREKGFFLTGKFDQFKRHIPYHALIQALRQLIHQLLTESEQNVQRWREQITASLGSNGSVIVEVIPELELILGKQPPAPLLPPTETQNRFQYTMQKFITVFTGREHPLVLFLDDLQWADAATLMLFEQFLEDAGTSHLLLIGAYRDNEITAADRLMVMVEELRQKRNTISQVHLALLNEHNVKSLVADTLQCESDESAPLAELVFQKTNGNPFFVKQFLQTLYAQKMVRFDSEAGAWRWDLDGIREMDITDNVVEFMLEKIRQLPERTQEVLKIASCIGSAFDLHTLIEVIGKPTAETALDLWDALQEGFLVPVGTAYKLLFSMWQESSHDILPEELRASFKFLHDRVQQVAYSMIPEESLPAVHLRIGKIMLRQSRAEEQEENLFDMVNHLNVGSNLLTAPEEQLQLMRLNLLAGRRAKASTAYEPALKYLRQGVDLLPKNPWQSAYDLCYELYMERSEVEYLCGYFGMAENLFDYILANVKTTLEKTNVYHIKSILYINQEKYEEVCRLCAEAIPMLGMKIPLTYSRTRMFAEILKSKWYLRGRTSEQLLNMPMASNPYQNQKMRLLINYLNAAYFIDQELFALLNLISLTTTLKHGNSIGSGLSYGGYGMLLGSVLGDYKLGYEFGRLAMQVHERIEYDLLKGQAYFGFATFINHWTRPIREGLELLREGYQVSIESGDRVYAVYSCTNTIHYLMMLGTPFEEVEREIDKYLDYVMRTKVEMTANNLRVVRACLARLKGEDIGGYDYPEHIRRCMEKGDLFQTGFTHHYQLRAAYLLGEYREALQIAEAAERVIGGAFGQVQLPEHYVFYSLTLTELYSSVSAQERRRYTRLLKKHLAKLRKWAKHAPENFLGKVQLLEAELARLQGDLPRAMDAYEAAIQHASEQGFLHYVAIANELAAKFYQQLGKERIAKTYLLEARYLYLKWGALEKVRVLDRAYPEWLTSSRTDVDNRLEVASAVGSMSTTGEHSMQQIDLQTVLKASRAISGEIVLSKLLENMIRIVAENAGAQRASLLIEREGELLLVAQKEPGREDVTVLQLRPFHECDDLAASVIQYVRRMKEPVVLHDASKEEMFAKDPYIEQHRPESIFCMPILNQGGLVGLLYLENNLTTHAFTEGRLQLMELLSSQIAVSLQNAELYQHQLALNRAYEKFVPHQFLRFLEKNSILDVQLGDHVQTNMSIMFADIRSFTTMSEKMTPEENFEFLNEYLRRMEAPIIENRGFIDKFIGDSIMALFDKGADDAVRAAVAMLHQLGLYNHERVQKGLAPIEIGIGLNSGRMMLGTLGGHHRMDSTVISDAVNLASRLEDLTKVYGVPLLISEHTYVRLVDPNRYCIRILDRVKVKGKTEPVSVYEVFEADPPEIRAGKIATKSLFDEAYEQFQREEYETAQGLFAKCLSKNLYDKTAAAYIQRCERLQKKTENETEISQG
ncbi:protein kinase domain-containing protein [Tumebacillus permanentifrigoris]|uniref:Putative ATPase n=1 Tax=Tumebacillus permanentifrigoris TaxID=378543 RepID=A0A316DBK8_9BACL|nr:AAA family ATPase [Tumebacillus permanentifrigoris]PWK14286.1 putative ATPase [Tumebacillus permanentifrigoris]